MHQTVNSKIYKLYREMLRFIFIITSIIIVRVIISEELYVTTLVLKLCIVPLYYLLY